MSLLNELKMASSQSYDAIIDINPSENLDDTKYNKYVYAVETINSAVDSINEFVNNTQEIRNSLMELLNKFKETINKIKTFADKIANYELATRANEVEQSINEVQSQFEPTILGAPIVPGMQMQQEPTIQRDKPKVRTLTPNYNTFRNAA